MRLPWQTKWRLVAAALAAVAALVPAPPAQAWGALGHHIVADLAAAQLTPQARATAQRLLAVRGARHLSQVANWADDLRDVDPDLFRRTRRLHFVNFRAPDCVFTVPRDCPHGQCAVAAIAKYSALLADRSRSDAERAEALAFLVHLVADVHQPLHADYRPDHGGNDIQVRWDGQGTNLHRVWDSLMLDGTHRSAAAYARTLQAATTAVVAGGTPAAWAEESCRIDRDGGVYPASRGSDIDGTYVARERPVAEMRLREAGVRLAMLLNRDLGNG